MCAPVSDCDSLCSDGQDEEVQELEDDDEDDGVEAQDDLMIVQCTVSKKWEGFKPVEDNLDKNVRPSFKQLDLTTRSSFSTHMLFWIEWTCLVSLRC